MKLLEWRKSRLGQRTVLVLTVVLVVLLASHPELRLLLPVVDALGLDLLLLLVGSQFLDYVMPALQLAHRSVRSSARWLYSSLIYMLGTSGPPLDARVTMRLRRNLAMKTSLLLCSLLIVAGCASSQPRPVPPVADAGQLPEDARRVVAKVAACNHLAGEFGGDRSTRDREVGAAMTKLHCETIDEDVRRIVARYPGDKELTAALKAAIGL